MTPLKSSDGSCFLHTQRRCDLLAKSYTPFLPIYQRTRHIVAIAYPRDFSSLSRDQTGKRVLRAWFITENSSILQILREFPRNNESYL